MIFVTIKKTKSSANSNKRFEGFPCPWGARLFSPLKTILWDKVKYSPQMLYLLSEKNNCFSDEYDFYGYRSSSTLKWLQHNTPRHAFSFGEDYSSSYGVTCLCPHVILITSYFTCRRLLYTYMFHLNHIVASADKIKSIPLKVKLTNI